ncbi:hypothetical protein NW754_003853 [Fusarium falciforme]|nr:hypothetical protein NW754_003853 [Fusarium falciforme]
MCKPPLPATTNPTTIATLTKSDPVSLTTDQDVSGTSSGSFQLPSASMIEDEPMPGLTTSLGSSNMPPKVTSIELPGTDLPGTSVSGTDVPGTDVSSTGGQDATSLTPDRTETGIPIVTTNSDGQVTTSPKQTIDPSMHIPSTVITNPDGQVTTIRPNEPSTVTTGTGSEVPTVQPDQSSEPGAVDTGTVITSTDGRVTTIPAERTN